MGSVGTKQDQMNIPYDEWGPMLTAAGDTIPVYDEQGRQVGEIYDGWQAESEPVVSNASKKDVLALAEGEWIDEEHGYGFDGDTAIYIQYNNGTLVDVSDLRKGKDGDKYKKFSKSGIVGIYVSTPWQAAAWGVEYARNPNYVYGSHEPRYLEQPMTIRVPDNSGDIVREASNSIMNFETIRERKVRYKETWNNPGVNYDGTRINNRKRTEIIRASEWKDMRKRL